MSAKSMSTSGFGAGRQIYIEPGFISHYSWWSLSRRAAACPRSAEQAHILAAFVLTAFVGRMDWRDRLLAPSAAAVFRGSGPF
jgi:hypothetical protein